MDVLIVFGFSIEDIKNMMDTNKEIEHINDNNIYKLIDILGNVGCLNYHIKNIFVTNPFFLSKNPKDVENLVNYLYSIGLNDLNILFDSNPYLLNLGKKDIEKIYKKIQKIGLNDEEVLDYFYYELDKII